MTSKYPQFIIVLLVTSLSFLLYINSLQSPFVFDDNHMIVENSYIKNPKYFSMFFKGFVTNYPVPKGMCRPLLMLTLAFNYLTGKLTPAGYRIINILFHFLNVISFYLLLKEIFARFFKKHPPEYAVLFPVLIFCVHPINTEAITYVSSRSDLMVTLFLILGILFHIKEKLPLSMISYVAALLAKETGLCFIFLMAGYDFIAKRANVKLEINPVRKLARGIRPRVSEIWNNPVASHRVFSNGIKHKISAYLSTALITTAYLIYKNTLFKPDFVLPSRSYYSNILTQAKISFFYLKLFLWPNSLNLIHNIAESNTIFEAPAFLAVLGIISAIIAAFSLARKYPLLSLGIGWYLIGIMPKFYARLKFIAMEHHFYLPGIGIYILIAYGTAIFHQIIKHKKIAFGNNFRLFSTVRKVFYTFLYHKNYIAIFILSTLSLLTFLRNLEYKNSFVFWKITAQRSPDSYTPHIGLGIEYMERQMWEEAGGEFKKAIELAKYKGDKIKGMVNLATTYQHQNDYDKAIKILQQVCRFKKPPLGAWRNLGVMYLHKNQKPEALDAWNKEINLYPQSTGTYIQLGSYYLREKEFSQAKDFFQKNIELDPDSYEGYHGLAQICEAEQNTDCAVKLYQKAIKLSPQENSVLYYCLGRLYIKSGNPQGLKYLTKTIEIDPNFAPAYNDLAVAFSSLNPPDWKAAKELAVKAKQLGYPVKQGFLELLNRNLNSR